jgi:hypothetical protein
MSTPPLDEVTQLLKAWAGGDERALDRLTPFVYEELHRVGQRCMVGERTGRIATGMRGSRADRQEPASLSLRESASLPGGTTS